MLKKYAILPAHTTTITLTETIIANSAFAAHVKDTRKGLYIDSNLQNAQRLGFASANELIGLTFSDVNNILQDYWGNRLSLEIESMEKKIIYERESVKEERAFIGFGKKLIVHKMIKMPIIGLLDNVCGILTLSENMTNQLDIIEILNLYKKLRPADFISCFLSHMNFGDFFNEEPSYNEMIVLLAKSKCSSHKEIALMLNLSVNTVSWYLSKVSEKVNVNKLISNIKKMGDKHE